MRALKIFAIGIGGLSAIWLIGSVMVRGRRSRVAPAQSPAKDIWIHAPDNLVIAGTFRPGAHDHSPSVLLLHGITASRAITAENAAWLASLGYATLAIDLRGHGGSSVATRTFGLLEAIEARAAFDWLKERQQDAPVAVIGISLGGAASLIGDAGPLPADALILQAVYPDIRRAIRNRIARFLSLPVAHLLEPLFSFQSLPRFGVWPSRLSPLEALKSYHGPVLLIGGEQDTSTPPVETRAMFAAANGPKEIWLSPSGGHRAICELSDAHYRTVIREFLAKFIPLTK